MTEMMLVVRFKDDTAPDGVKTLSGRYHYLGALARLDAARQNSRFLDFSLRRP